MWNTFNDQENLQTKGLVEVPSKYQRIHQVETQVNTKAQKLCKYFYLQASCGGSIIIKRTESFFSYSISSSPIAALWIRSLQVKSRKKGRVMT